MPLVVSAKVSTDANNALKAGADAGLWAGTTNHLFDNQPEYMLENGWASTGSYWYPLGLNGVGTSSTIPSGQGVFQAFMVNRPARIAGWSAYVSVVNSSANLGGATYASDRVTGLPTTKISDLSYVSGNGNSGSPAAVSTTFTNMTVYQPRTLYWIANWNYQYTPTWSCRTNFSWHPMRLAFPPTNLASNYWPTVVDTTSNWTSLNIGPTSVNVNYPGNTTTNPGSTPIALWIQLINV